MTILEAKSLSKIYNTDTTEIRAVDDISLSVEVGEFVALVGPSGSGKTTILALLAGLLRPTQGEIIVKNRTLNQMSEAKLAAFRLSDIGFTFQANNLVSYLTVRENVELMLRLNGKFNTQGKKRVEDLLDRLGLAKRLNNLPVQLSGGQQQRVAIARALVHDPSIVLADEPTANLGYGASHSGGANLCRSDPRAKSGGGHGDSRFTDVWLCRSNFSDGRWSCGPDYLRSSRN